MTGHIETNPYQNMRLPRGESEDRKFLTKEELRVIETKEIEDTVLSKVRDTFLFCCYTGLAYADLSKFDFSKAVHSNGMYRIRDYRQKTSTQFNISLMDKAMAVLKKYDFQLPIMSNQKYNDYLKVIGSYCGVKQKLTSHAARHINSSYSLKTRNLQRLSA